MSNLLTSPALYTPPKARNDPLKAAKRTVLDFANNTTIHGIVYIFDTTLFILERQRFTHPSVFSRIPKLVFPGDLFLVGLKYVELSIVPIERWDCRCSEVFQILLAVT